MPLLTHKARAQGVACATAIFLFGVLVPLANVTVPEKETLTCSTV